MPTTVAVPRCLSSALGLVTVPLAWAFAAAPAQAALGDRTPGKGHRGSDVKAMQALRERAGFSTRLDGVFDRRTDLTARRLEQSAPRSPSGFTVRHPEGL